MDLFTGNVAPSGGELNQLVNEINRVAALSGGASLASPAFTGVPTAPTAAPGTNTTQLATTAFVLANAGGASIVHSAGNTAAFSLTLPIKAAFPAVVAWNTTANAPTEAINAVLRASYVGNAAQLVPVKTCVGTMPEVTGTYDNGTAGVGATITTVSATLDTTDTTAVSNGDRVLLPSQASTLENGVYTVAGVGSAIVFTRATDFDQPAEMSEGHYVCSGTQNGIYVQNTTGAISVGTSAINMALMPGMSPTSNLGLGNLNAPEVISAESVVNSIEAITFIPSLSATQDVFFVAVSPNAGVLPSFGSASVAAQIMFTPLV